MAKKSEDGESQKVAQYHVRMPASLRDALKSDARKHGRSLNVHVQFVLQKHIDPDGKMEFVPVMGN